MSIALSHSEEIAGDIIELSILTKNNICYKYRISENAYHYFDRLRFFYGHSHCTDTMLLKDFLDREDCAEYKEFDIFVSDEYKTISCRTMDMEPDYIGDNISFFENITVLYNFL